METLEQVKRNVADLYWLAMLLTGCRETATEVTFQALKPADDANPFFSTWMRSWSRRNVIARALAAVREDIARSAHWMEARPVENCECPPQSWALERVTTKSDLERALIPIEAFPRAAVLLLLFEGVPLEDAAVLLDAGPDSVRNALAAGVRELTINLARMQGWQSAVSGSNTDCEAHHVRSTEIPS